MELYWPPFEGAVEAGVLSVMCANNLVNGVYVCENNHTENTILKSWGGFKGWVCSDYDGTRSTIDAANGGLDIAMPGPVRLQFVCSCASLPRSLSNDFAVCFAALADPSRFFRHNAARPAQSGHCEAECSRREGNTHRVRMAIASYSPVVSLHADSRLIIVIMGLRYVRDIFGRSALSVVLGFLYRYSLAKVGALDTPRPPTAGADVTSAAHLALARKLASAACILLKNEGEILPLSMDTKVAVIGDAGNEGAIFGGDGSGTVSSSDTPLISRVQLTDPWFSFLMSQGRLCRRTLPPFR